MSKGKFLAAGVVIGLIVGAFALRLSGADAKTLTAQDYADIMQLYYRYAQALDRSDGQAWAATFTPDGQIYAPPPGVIPGNGLLDGRQAIAAYVKGSAKEFPGVHHVTVNVSLEKTPTGAKGVAYLLLTTLESSPPRFTGGGLYDDILVKTSEGWHFKKRTYLAAKVAPAPAAPAR